jgi:predicted anti-sigma-YlaC factor YlaD
MMPSERTIAGLRCGDVLALLSDYLDGEMEGDERTRLEEHVRGCPECTQFGGVFGQVVSTLKRTTLADERTRDLGTIVERALSGVPGEKSDDK